MFEEILKEEVEIKSFPHRYISLGLRMQDFVVCGFYKPYLFKLQFLFMIKVSLLFFYHYYCSLVEMYIFGCTVNNKIHNHIVITILTMRCVIEYKLFST